MSTAVGRSGQWPFALGYGLSYLAVCFLFVLWTASWVSALAPPAGAIAVSPERLRARLLALEQAAPGLQVEPGPTDDVLRVIYRSGPDGAAGRCACVSMPDTDGCRPGPTRAFRAMHRWRRRKGR